MDDPKTPVTDPTADPVTDPAADPAAPLGEAGLKALQTERAARKAAETELARLQAEIRDSETAAMRADVGRVHRLPPALARRLVGTTREELEADAIELAAALAPTVKTTPKETLQPGAIPASRPEPSASTVVDQVLGR